MAKHYVSALILFGYLSVCVRNQHQWAPVNAIAQVLANAFPTGSQRSCINDEKVIHFLGSVIDRLSEYLIHYDVQLGASYEVSAQAGQKLNEVVKI